MNTPLSSQNLLSGRDLEIVDGRTPEMRKAGAESRTGGGNEREASRTAVQIDDKLRPEAAESPQRRRQNRGDIGITGEDIAEAILNDDCDPEVGPRCLQNPEGGCCENTVPKRPQPNEGNGCAFRQGGQN